MYIIAWCYKNTKLHDGSRVPLTIWEEKASNTPNTPTATRLSKQPSRHELCRHAVVLCLSHFVTASMALDLVSKGVVLTWSAWSAWSGAARKQAFDAQPRLQQRAFNEGGALKIMFHVVLLWGPNRFKHVQTILLFESSTRRYKELWKATIQSTYSPLSSKVRNCSVMFALFYSIILCTLRPCQGTKDIVEDNAKEEHNFKERNNFLLVANENCQIGRFI